MQWWKLKNLLFCMQHNYQQLSGPGRAIGLMCLCVCTVTLMAFNLDNAGSTWPLWVKLEGQRSWHCRKFCRVPCVKVVGVTSCCCSCVHFSLLTSVIEDVASQYRATAVVHTVFIKVRRRGRWRQENQTSWCYCWISCWTMETCFTRLHSCFTAKWPLFS